MERNLNSRQQAAIMALISERTIEGAAVTAHIGKTTLFRWLQDDDFREAYRSARSQVLQQSIARIQGACGEAVNTLIEVMRDGECSAPSRVAAARTVLEMAFKGELEDLDARLRRIEQTLNTKRGIT